MKRFFLILLLALLAQPVPAQTGTATFSGRIIDESGPIEGVTVVAIHQSTNAQYYATTDRRGWWQLLDVLPGGPYTLRIHYFGYDPLTVRNIYTYSGQNTVVDANLETKTVHVRCDEAATSLRLGPELGGGTVPVSPLGYDLVSQRISTPVAFDVRQEASLYGTAQQWMTPTGASRFHAAAYDYYGFGSSVTPGATGILGNTAGLWISTPLGSQDYQLFAGAQYDASGLTGAGRFDGRIDASNRVAVSGGCLTDEAWAGGEWISSLGNGRASNRAQAIWSSDASVRQLLAGDDFTFSAGSQRLLAGVQFAHQNFLPADSTANRFDFYLQDAARLGQRITLLAGVRFAFPFTFSPRISICYDVTGTGSVVLRAGTAVYGRHGQPSTWKSLAAVDTRLPLGLRLTLEGIYGQDWERLFIISSRNTLDSHYALTARVERPFADRAWALVSYTRSDGWMTDRLMAGFSYKAEYLGRQATMLSVLYDGVSYVDEQSPASLSWMHGFKVRLSQDIVFQAAGRDHTLQLTGYLRHASIGTQFLVGLRYML